MANGRFSRGVEVIADASLAFVGNIDMSVEQIVHSSQHDLFQPLPSEFDLAVMDRFACYLPGWEMPKNSSEYLTNNYGFITDYLAEAFHHLFQRTNRYEEVTKRIQLGKAVEGRDEKGIKKTVAAFLKILHPGTSPSDQEFEEYVAYAIECRRRVKEQMNKRKPGDEFARINLSYYSTKGEEVVVFCPESKDAAATQNPIRRALAAIKKPTATKMESRTPAQPTDANGTDKYSREDKKAPQVPTLKEQHFTVYYGDTGYSYDSIFGPYLQGATSLLIEDPYIRAPHQIQNFVRFCETVVKAQTCKRIKLITSHGDDILLSEIQAKLGDLKQSLLELDITLDIEFSQNIHDREVRLDNGWIIKIGRGLDIYQKPLSWFEIGANDMYLRKCLETKINIFRAE
ncbi:hypothetical protein ISF26_02740 [Gloeobacter morelensis MG652769]|uniref:MITD1 C-terminal phospholipase D-like domain-containing protein n=1 Tax=Gloeobacter morelensis MG652769 TaxID=2781736 RepID=A0ABY3PNJ6_9CYAN|nr:BREX system Lon protease-like protein BrxL [Gloeobacter morelensis]UFP95185.1 hypothetical protein ISF26_02740 [Gloeobacter morelensis MG652769]